MRQQNGKHATSEYLPGQCPVGLGDVTSPHPLHSSHNKNRVGVVFQGKKPKRQTNKQVSVRNSNHRASCLITGHEFLPQLRPSPFNLSTSLQTVALRKTQARKSDDVIGVHVTLSSKVVSSFYRMYSMQTNIHNAKTHRWE